VREKARATACLSNLKQVGLAVSQYTQDNDETFMYEYRAENADDTTFPHNRPTLPNGRLAGWFTQPASGLPCATGHPAPCSNWAYELQPYIKNRGVMACPSAPDQTGWNPPTPDDRISYVCNTYILDGLNLHGPASTLAQLPDPADLVFIWDGGNSTAVVQIQGWNGYAVVCDDHHPFNPSSTCPRCWSDWLARHQGGRNYVFADGHAKWALDSNMFVQNHTQKWDGRCQK
jgi:prepilin-type processing-associated H-X9-DG protein